jgi:hypothetical protein
MFRHFDELGELWARGCPVSVHCRDIRLPVCVLEDRCTLDSDVASAPLEHHAVCIATKGGILTRCAYCLASFCDEPRRVYHTNHSGAGPSARYMTTRGLLETLRLATEPYVQRDMADTAGFYELGDRGSGRGVERSSYSSASSSSSSPPQELWNARLVTVETQEDIMLHSTTLRKMMTPHDWFVVFFPRSVDW